MAPAWRTASRKQFLMAAALWLGAQLTAGEPDGHTSPYAASCGGGTRGERTKLLGRVGRKSNALGAARRSSEHSANCVASAQHDTHSHAKQSPSRGSIVL